MNGAPFDPAPSAQRKIAELRKAITALTDAQIKQKAHTAREAARADNAELLGERHFAGTPAMEGSGETGRSHDSISGAYQARRREVAMIVPRGTIRSAGPLRGLLRFLRRYARIGWPGRGQ